MLENIRIREKKSVRVLSIVTILSLICCITLVVIAAHKPGSPEFCAKCHSMTPSYITWKETVSCNTGCLGCHTHDNSGRTLSVEIEDSNCTNIECHPLGKLTSKLSNYKEKISFNHETHLQKFSTNLKLKCTGCHSRLSHSVKSGTEKRHFGINEGACFACHFIEGKFTLLTNDKEKINECELCHKDVQVKVMIYEKEFDHLKYENELKVECKNCHFETIRKKNSVDKKDCYYCHTKIPNEYEGADRMHNDHVEKHNVPCSPCHSDILHKWNDEYANNVLSTRDIDTRAGISTNASTMTKDVIPDKVAVVASEESIFKEESFYLQKKIYAGKGGIGVECSPDPMYLATVNCIACHRDGSLRVDPMACNTCHEKGFDKTMAEQKEYITAMLKSLSGLIKESQECGVSKALIQEASYNYKLIDNDRSFGVHNIKYIKDLIDYSMRELRLATNHQLGSE